MAPGIDAELELIDKKHAQLARISTDLVDALNLYHQVGFGRHLAVERWVFGGGAAAPKGVLLGPETKPDIERLGWLGANPIWDNGVEVFSNHDFLFLSSSLLPFLFLSKRFILCLFMKMKKATNSTALHHLNNQTNICGPSRNLLLYFKTGLWSRYIRCTDSDSDSASGCTD